MSTIESDNKLPVNQIIINGILLYELESIANMSPIQWLYIAPTNVVSTVQDDMLSTMLNAAVKYEGSSSQSSTAKSSPVIRTVLYGSSAGSNSATSTTSAVPKVVIKVEEESPATADTKQIKFFIENGNISCFNRFILLFDMSIFVGKRMHMVQQVRTDGRTGKQMTIYVKQEYWTSEEEDNNDSL